MCTYVCMGTCACACMHIVRGVHVLYWPRLQPYVSLLQCMRAPLQFAWTCNIFVLVAIIALLLWDILSYYGEIPFGDVLGAMVVADLTGLASAPLPPT
jgi:hypothetical protein